MKSAMLGLLAETPIHPGAGRSLGVIDLPVARESTTDYPVIAGSSLKGAFRDKAQKMQVFDSKEVDRLFGKQDHAGELLISDARILLLPVRSLTSSFRWATCPHLIDRCHRDLARAGLSTLHEVSDVEVERGKVLARGDGHLFLEERQFAIGGDPDEALVTALKPFILHPETQKTLDERIVVLNDCDFAWFARYGLTVQARNVLEEKTKRSKNLWYEETLPPDTVMYALFATRTDTEMVLVVDAMFPERDPYLQVGGNETVGQGWFAVSKIISEEGENA
ncbi:MAG: type III-B CRISPR module RAMP protein Cmr4 [Candidatus Dadabacteria bacterium]|nr:type III-B CRISPR module RAMP protein Cmr4 [Candidatus Dadabacteria bacterium]